MMLLIYILKSQQNELYQLNKVKELVYNQLDTSVLMKSGYGLLFCQVNKDNSQSDYEKHKNILR